MISDEEKKAIDLLKNIDKQKCMMLECPVVKNNIERQLKIIELNRTIRKQSKEIEELKENKKFLEKQEIEYIRDRVEDEVNFKWEDKIKAKIEELNNLNSPFAQLVINAKEFYFTELIQNILQIFLEKE